MHVSMLDWKEVVGILLVKGNIVIGNIILIVLEFREIHLYLQSRTSCLPGHMTRVQSNNTTALVYINHQRGT